MEITRRSFIKTTAIAGAAAAAPAFIKRGNAYGYDRTYAGFKKGLLPLPMPGLDIPVAVPNKKWFPGVDWYTIEAQQFTQVLHPAFAAKPTTLFGYVDGNNPVPRHLGGIIIANRGTPCRIRFRNKLPATHILPIDTTIPGAETGQHPCRASVHLHGGFVPWASDGGPFHWIAPAGATGATTGPSYLKWLPGNAGNLTADLWYPNQESARMMWYHDHAVGITRLNAYAGLATAYIVRDDRERAMVAQGILPPFIEDTLGGGRAAIREIPVVFQDKIFKAADGSLVYPSRYDPTIWALAPGALGPPPPISAIPEMFGDVMCANGIPYPLLEVEQRRYRLRFLNACNSRFLRMQLVFAVGNAWPDNVEPQLDPVTKLPNNPGPGFYCIGNEGGFLTQPFGARKVILGPAERLDCIVNFASVPAGSYLVLYNDAPGPFPNGNPIFDFHTGATGAQMSQYGYGPNTRTIMTIKVNARVGAKDPVPNWNPWPAQTMDPVAVPGVVPGSTAIPAGITPRRLVLAENTDGYGRLKLQIGNNVKNAAGGWGLNYFPDAPTEVVTPGAVEVWEVVNLTADTHPMHFHLQNGQVISRQHFSNNTPLTYNGTPAYVGAPVPCNPLEMGWKETVLMHPGQVTRVAFKWDLPPDAFVTNKTTGVKQVVPVPTSPRTGGHEYVWHCHILEHEEHDMMRPLIVQ